MKLNRLDNKTLMLALVAATAAHASPTVSPGVLAAAVPTPTAVTVAAQGPMQQVATTPAQEPAKPPVSPQVGSYDIGLLFGSQLEHNGLMPQVSLEEVIRGLKDSAGGRAVKPEERDAAMQFMRDARSALTEKNRAAGREFLVRNAKEPGIKTMPSGLQYRVLAAGDPGAKPPAPIDQVTVRYRASFTDGTEFDRSDTHDRPATFRVNSVFKGWQEAFLSMKPGAKWQLFVPPELGYGANPPPAVPPGAVLVYELELLQIEPGAPVPKP
jgi:FKBP-type peptidyl-prolyl cis-trans isomerase